MPIGNIALSGSRHCSGTSTNSHNILIERGSTTLNSRDMLSDVVDNALLNLYLTIAETSRLTPQTKRNEILIRYLKPMIKDKRYQSSKKEIRSLLVVGRTKICDLEAKLVELRNLSLSYDKTATNARCLFNLLTIIESVQGLPSRFLNDLNDTLQAPNVIYLLKEQVENGFIESGKQVAAISLFLESDVVPHLVDAINDTKLFQAKIQQHNLLRKQGHIVLHPTEST